MEKKAPILLIGGLALIVAIALIFAKPMVSWNITYYYKSKAPYGTNFIYRLLESKYEKENFKVINEPFDAVYEKLEADVSYDYFKIGYNRRSSDEEMDAFFSFIEKGNNAFIALEDFDFSILDSLFRDECEEWRSYKTFNKYDDYEEEDEDTVEELEVFEVFTERDSTQSSLDDYLDSLDQHYFYDSETDADIAFDTTTSAYSSDSFDISSDLTFDGYWINKFTSTKRDSIVSLNFTDVDFCREDSSYNFPYFYKLDTLFYSWNYFYLHCLKTLDSIQFKVLGGNNSNKITFFEIPIGKGSLYVHTMPLVFTNVELLAEDRLEYVEKTMSYFSGEKLLWDIYASNNFGNYKPSDLDESGSPLSYFLSEPALRWSIYFIVLAALLFILFRAKRRQQYIPVIEPNVNTSIDYVEMMGQLYFEEKDHHFIANQMWKKFLDYIRVHYYITPKEGDISWIKKVAEKSQVNQTKITGILRAYEKTKFVKITEEELINFYEKLNYFYSNCK